MVTRPPQWSLNTALENLIIRLLQMQQRVCQKAEEREEERETPLQDVVFIPGLGQRFNDVRFIGEDRIAEIRRRLRDGRR